MEDQQKRIEEIKTEVADILKSELSAQEKLDRLNELKAERATLETEIQAHNVALELGEDAPEVKQPKAEAEEEAPAEEEKPAEEEAPAETPAEEPAAPAEEDAPAEAPAPEAIAAAVSNTTPKDDSGESKSMGLSIIASTSSVTDIGSQMTAEHFGKMHRGIASKGGDGSQMKFATIRRFEGDESETVGSRRSAIENTVSMYKGNKNNEIAPLTAAACFCGPFETDKNVDVIGLTERPVQGSFRTVPVTGPFDYFPNLAFGDYAGGVNQWECADQTAVTETPSTWKPCVDLTCETATTVNPYAVVACGRVSTYQQLSHPELVDAFIRALGIQYARTAEQLLLDQIRATSTEITYAPTAGHGLLWQLEKVIAHLAGLSVYGHRVRPRDYTLFVSPGLLQVLTVDEHLRGFSRGANTESILSQLRQVGVGRVVELLDVDTTAEAGYAAAAATYIDPGNTVAFDQCTAIGDWTAYLVPTDSYTVGLSTMVEAGWTRDSKLIRQNLVQYFEEGLEFIEKINDVPSYTLTLTGAGNGVTSALAEVPSCVPVIP